MRYWTRMLTMVWCMACCALAAWSQVTINGTVVDEAGQPIEFATVRILGTAIGVNTDLKGQYELKVAERDTLMVEFSCIGYATVTRQLVKPKGTVTINPKLYEKRCNWVRFRSLNTRSRPTRCRALIWMPSGARPMPAATAWRLC